MSKLEGREYTWGGWKFLLQRKQDFCNSKDVGLYVRTVKRRKKTAEARKSCETWRMEKRIKCVSGSDESAIYISENASFWNAKRKVYWKSMKYAYLASFLKVVIIFTKHYFQFEQHCRGLWRVCVKIIYLNSRKGFMGQRNETKNVINCLLETPCLNAIFASEVVSTCFLMFHGMFFQLCLLSWSVRCRLFYIDWFEEYNPFLVIKWFLHLQRQLEVFYLKSFQTERCKVM